MSSIWQTTVPTRKTCLFACFFANQTQPPVDLLVLQAEPDRSSWHMQYLSLCSSSQDGSTVHSIERRTLYWRCCNNSFWQAEESLNFSCSSSRRSRSLVIDSVTVSSVTFLAEQAFVMVRQQRILAWRCCSYVNSAVVEN